jgi:integrase
MTGCTFKRKLKSGAITWGYSIDAGYDANGKRKRVFKSGFETKQEAADELRKLLNKKDTGEPVAPDPQTFAGFTEEWFSIFGKRKCSLKTLERYRQLVDYILPHIGHVRLQDLSALGLERVFYQLKDAGGRHRRTGKPRPLSAKSICHVAGVVNVILKKAIKEKLLLSNPMEGVDLPSPEPHEARVLDAEQMAWFMDAARRIGIYELLEFCAATGCRRGEALSLTWPDLDLENGVARISKSLEQTRAGLRLKSTKGKKSRAISLPASTVVMLRALAVTVDENRKMCGPDYSELNLVFCDPAGNYLKPDSITAKVCLMARKLGLEHVSMHTLRHSHGSQLLSAGVPLPAVSKRLGHSNVYTTATVYSHAMPQDDVAAAEAWDKKVHRNVTPINRKVS